jgi:hypothetical protein
VTDVSNALGIPTGWVEVTNVTADNGGTIVTFIIAPPSTSSTSAAQLVSDFNSQKANPHSELYNGQVTQYLQGDYKPNTLAPKKKKSDNTILIVACSVGGFVAVLALLGVSYYLYGKRDSAPGRNSFRKNPTTPPKSYELQSQPASPSATDTAVTATPSPPAAAPPAAGGWSQMYDPTQGAYYWYNAATGESQWDRPVGVTA